MLKDMEISLMKLYAIRNDEINWNYKDIENSIIKKFRKKIWARFIRAINEYELVQAGDKIAVCISGGKDSFLLAKCLEELKRHGKINFSLEYLIMDPGYNKENINLIKQNLKSLNLKATIITSDIFNIITKEKGTSPCYLCARMRRGFLYSKAHELGCNKIALGHHFNDVIETIMLNIIYAGEYKTMMPKLVSDNFANMELIRPLYYVKEEDIKAWALYNNLNFLNCACKVTLNKGDSKRQEIKELIKTLTAKYKNADINIMRSSENINLEAIIGYRQKKDKKLFLDNYNKK